MEPEEAAADQLAALKKQLVDLHREAAKTTSWAHERVLGDIRSTKGKIAKLVFPKFTAMDAQQLWEYLGERQIAVIARLQTLLYLKARVSWSGIRDDPV